MQHKHTAFSPNIRHWKLRTALLALDLFVGLTAVFGGMVLLLGISQMPIEWLRNTPFRSYLVPGVVLMVIVGGSAAVAAVATWVKSEWDAFASLVAGVILTGWIFIEVAMIGLQSALQPFYLLLGLLMIVLAERLLGIEWRSNP